MQVQAVGGMVWADMAVGKLPRPSTAMVHISLTIMAIQTMC